MPFCCADVCCYKRSMCSSKINYIYNVNDCVILQMFMNKLNVYV